MSATEDENARYEASYADFTEASYVEALRLAKRTYAFARYHERPSGRHVLWRHDIDYSPQRALALARLEHEEGVRATYFFMTRCYFYNLFSEACTPAVHEILRLGHDLALHFDVRFDQHAERAVVLEHIAREKRWLEEVFGVAPVALSFHAYGVLPTPPPDDDVVAGMVNAYGKSIWNGYTYTSDSNGVWRFRRLHDVLAEGAAERLQVLTHPEWWTPTAMSPRARIQRCLDGYAAAAGKHHDDYTEASGRPNPR